ncbi:MAG: lactoylglutathione lyase [Pseudomonadota bacterium]
MPVPPHGATGPGHVAFGVKNSAELDQWKTRLEHHALDIEQEITWPNGARSLYLRDPAQNSVEIAETRLWAP